MANRSSILFVCTGNSVRSQMAEGFARYYGGAAVEVASAGTRPAGLNDFAIWAMNETGIDISKHTSDSIDSIDTSGVDYVITLCGDARDNCPSLDGRNVDHWALPDPAGVRGGPQVRIEAFRTVRNEIEKRVKGLLTGIFEG